jgi:3-isopropylmalate dehydrogenase
MGMEKKIAVLPGDGIGPEVTQEAIKVLRGIEEAFGHSFSLTYGDVGAIAIDKTGDPFPVESEDLCKNSDAILFGAIGDPKYDNDPSAKVRPEEGLLRMRKALGLFANIRPVQTYEQLLDMSPLKKENVRNVDFTVYRELTGGIYFGKPSHISEDGTSAVDTCLYSNEEIIRIAKLAFEAAGRRSGKLTLVDKANVLSTSRLWRKTIQELKDDYPKVMVDYIFVDNAAMQIILNPSQFDVILTENMFGDIITDEASVISGSIGLMPSASVGDSVALYEPIHGSYPQAKGKNTANPMASILSLAMLLENSFGLTEESNLISKAVETAISEGVMTMDLNPQDPKNTSEVGDFITDLIRKNQLEQLEN